MRAQRRRRTAIESWPPQRMFQRADGVMVHRCTLMEGSRTGVGPVLVGGHQHEIAGVPKWPHQQRMGGHRPIDFWFNGGSGGKEGHAGGAISQMMHNCGMNVALWISTASWLKLAEGFLSHVV